jgi:hypothetical protein
MRDAEAFELRTFSTRCETRTGNAERTAVERHVVSHVSKTASVHTRGRVQAKEEEGKE